MKTIKQILKNNGGIKRSNEIPILIAKAIKKEKEFIFTHPEYKLKISEYLKLRCFLYKLKKNYPLAYITKNKEFFNLDFYINENVLVPRPETEIMVEKTIKIINKKENKQKILLVDVGTGSGCIPISILKNINKKIHTIAIDVSKKALGVVKINIKKHNADIELNHGNLLTPIINNKILNNYTNLIITANLPYLTEKQFKNELSIQREPKKALIADNDGLELYIQLLKQIQNIQKKYKININFLLEIDPGQTIKISNLIDNKFKLKIHKDLAKNSRIIQGINIFASNH